jgi:cellulose synthase/poly-beta-1,6-N-acetylglucosamine synthase-like glycosyltransferase
MKINGITVCVDYSDMLELTIPNRHLFDKWTIVTIERDTPTIDLCKKFDLHCVFSDRLYDGGTFCKGKAINDGLLAANPQDWVCLVDADSLLFASHLRTFLEETQLDTDCLYGVMGRLLVKDKDGLDEALGNLKNITEKDLTHVKLLVGYFQMWHSSMRPLYPEESHNAGLDDVLMRDGYDQKKWRYLPTYSIHIGEMWKNHNGKNQHHS